jgi:hypothetical protein
MTRPLLPAALAVLLLAGCAPSGGPAPSAAQIAACRQRAEEINDRQNRGDVYRDDSRAGGARDAMFSGAGSLGGQVGQLSARYAHERRIDACLRGAAPGVAAPEPAAAPPRPRP